MHAPTSPHYPDFDTFEQLAQRADFVPVYRRLLSDALTPVTAFHKIDAGRCACLFESVVGGEKVGRYSFLATEPYFELEAYDNRVTTSTYSGVSAAGVPTLVTRQFESENPLDELRHRIEAVREATLPELPPFCSGAVGYAGYDVVRYFEHLPNAPPDDRQVPDLAFAFYDRMVIFDNVSKVIFVVAMARLDTPGTSPAKAYEAACGRVDRLVEQLSVPQDDVRPVDICTDGDVSLPYRSNFTQGDFEKAVDKCVEYIRAGDIFQVVFSQRLEVPIRAHPFEIYRVLRVVNPSPFMFYVRTPSVTLVGSSPEVMARVIDGKLTVRPLAGTRRRGATEEEDRQLAEELLADPKERAEHIMLVDLGRNDVGRVCQYRTVELTDVMTIERYSHVMHITSNVDGQLAPGKTAFDALQACLPAGTVSGAPKVRAMEIIDEIEPHRRGPYAGAVGYFDFNGNMDTCIALRTIVVQGNTAYVQAGAGIVADSVPENEWHETLNKARGLLKAIELAEEQVQRR
ncbi:MAG: anthranilate synthase component I [Planctomycetes bacterium RBG_13_63_9]|nr:MAG: anthranilate synthase component I [Planctomycetes bacterium RBG_13_63_9]